MDIIFIIALIVAIPFALWFGLKLLAWTMFQTPVGAVVGLGWGCIWGLAACKSFGWLPFDLISWETINAWPLIISIPAHVVGWCAGMGSLFLVFFLLKDNPSDVRMWALCALLVLLLGPAIAVAASSYITFMVVGTVLILLAIGSAVRR